MASQLDQVRVLLQ